MKKTDPTHREIVDLVFDLAKSEHNTYLEVKKEKRVEELYEKFKIQYKPDVHAFAKKRKGRIDVCEVWHTEPWGKAFLDILNSLLIPGIDWIHIIIIQRDKHRDSWEKSDVKNIKRRLNQILKSSAREKLDRLFVVGITEVELRRKAYLREKLTNELFP